MLVCEESTTEIKKEMQAWLDETMWVKLVSLVLYLLICAETMCVKLVLRTCRPCGELMLMVVVIYVTKCLNLLLSYEA